MLAKAAMFAAALAAAGTARAAGPDEAAVSALVLRSGVPADELASAVARSGRGSSPALVQMAYALAYNAVQKKLVAQRQRDVYVNYTLPALRRGCIAVLAVPEGSLKAAAATYDDVEDAIRIPDFTPGDAVGEARMLHELIHVGQDAAAQTQYRAAAEAEAYAAETEYLLRSKGVFHEEGDGSVAIKSGDVSELTDTEKFLVYLHASENFKKGRSELNDFTDATQRSGGAPFKSSRDPDVGAYFDMQTSTMREKSDSLWAMATMYGGLSGGAVRNTGELLRRDGLTRCPSE